MYFPQNKTGTRHLRLDFRWSLVSDSRSFPKRDEKLVKSLPSTQTEVFSKCPVSSNYQKAVNNPLILTYSLAFLKTSWCSESSKHLGNGRWEMDQCAVWNSCILICWCSGFLSCYYVSRCRWVCIIKRSQSLIRLSDRRRKKTQILTESYQIEGDQWKV